MCHCKTCADRLHVIIVITAIAILYSLASCLIRFPFLHTSIPFTSQFFYVLPIVHDTSSNNAQMSPATTSFLWHHTNTCKNHGYNAVADDSGQVSSATTSFPWHHTNTCKNHGYNAVADDTVADDYGQVSSAKTSFSWRHTNTRKNHGYNAVADDSGQVSSATTSFPWHHTNTCKNNGYNAVTDDAVAGDYGQVSSAKTSFSWRHTNTRKNHGYNAVAEVSCAGSHVVPRILHSLLTQKVKKKRGQTFSDHTYPTVCMTKGDMCAKFGLDRLRNLNLYKVQTKQTKKQTNFYL